MAIDFTPDQPEESPDPSVPAGEGGQTYNPQPGGDYGFTPEPGVQDTGQNYGPSFAGSEATQSWDGDAGTYGFTPDETPIPSTPYIPEGQSGSYDQQPPASNEEIPMGQDTGMDYGPAPAPTTQRASGPYGFTSDTETEIPMGDGKSATSGNPLYQGAIGDAQGFGREGFFQQGERAVQEFQRGNFAGAAKEGFGAVGQALFGSGIPREAKDLIGKANEYIDQDPRAREYSQLEQANKQVGEIPVVGGLLQGIGRAVTGPAAFAQSLGNRIGFDAADGGTDPLTNMQRAGGTYDAKPETERFEFFKPLNLDRIPGDSDKNVARGFELASELALDPFLYTGPRALGLGAKAIEATGLAGKAASEAGEVAAKTGILDSMINRFARGEVGTGGPILEATLDLASRGTAGKVAALPMLAVEAVAETPWRLARAIGGEKGSTAFVAMALGAGGMMMVRDDGTPFLFGKDNPLYGMLEHVPADLQPLVFLAVPALAGGVVGRAATSIPVGRSAVRLPLAAKVDSGQYTPTQLVAIARTVDAPTKETVLADFTNKSTSLTSMLASRVLTLGGDFTEAPVLAMISKALAGDDLSPAAIAARVNETQIRGDSPALPKEFFNGDDAVVLARMQKVIDSRLDAPQTDPKLREIQISEFLQNLADDTGKTGREVVTRLIELAQQDLARDMNHGFSPFQSTIQRFYSLNREMSFNKVAQQTLLTDPTLNRLISGHRAIDYFDFGSKAYQEVAKNLRSLNPMVVGSAIKTIDQVMRLVQASTTRTDMGRFLPMSLDPTLQKATLNPLMSAMMLSKEIIGPLWLTARAGYHVANTTTNAIITTLTTGGAVRANLDLAEVATRIDRLYGPGFFEQFRPDWTRELLPGELAHQPQAGIFQRPLRALQERAPVYTGLASDVVRWSGGGGLLQKMPVFTEGYWRTIAWATNLQKDVADRTLRRVEQMGLEAHGDPARARLEARIIVNRILNGDPTTGPIRHWSEPADPTILRGPFADVIRTIVRDSATPDDVMRQVNAIITSWTQQQEAARTAVTSGKPSAVPGTRPPGSPAPPTSSPINPLLRLPEFDYLVQKFKDMGFKDQQSRRYAEVINLMAIGTWRNNGVKIEEFYGKYFHDIESVDRITGSTGIQQRQRPSVIKGQTSFVRNTEDPGSRTLRAVVTLTRGQADESTVIHELAHVHRRIMGAEYQTAIYNWALTGKKLTDAEKQEAFTLNAGRADTDIEWTRAIEEAWARGVEQWWKTGGVETQSPTQGARRAIDNPNLSATLREIMNDFRSWIKAVYEQLVAMGGKDTPARFNFSKNIEKIYLRHLGETGGGAPTLSLPVRGPSDLTGGIPRERMVIDPGLRNTAQPTTVRPPADPSTAVGTPASATNRPITGVSEGGRQSAADIAAGRGVPREPLAPIRRSQSGVDGQVTLGGRTGGTTARGSTARRGRKPSVEDQLDAMTDRVNRFRERAGLEPRVDMPPATPPRSVPNPTTPEEMRLATRKRLTDMISGKEPAWEVAQAELKRRATERETKAAAAPVETPPTPRPIADLVNDARKLMADGGDSVDLMRMVEEIMDGKSAARREVILEPLYEQITSRMAAINTELRKLKDAPKEDPAKVALVEQLKQQTAYGAALDGRKPLTLNQEELAHRPVDTKSPAFRRWFAGSAAKDMRGNPIRLYHGTGLAGFDSFDISRLSEDSLYGRGIYLTDNRDIGSSYTTKEGGAAADVIRSPENKQAFLDWIRRGSPQFDEITSGPRPKGWEAQRYDMLLDVRRRLESDEPIALKDIGAKLAYLDGASLIQSFNSFKVDAKFRQLASTEVHDLPHGPAVYLLYASIQRPFDARVYIERRGGLDRLLDQMKKNPSEFRYEINNMERAKAEDPAAFAAARDSWDSSVAQMVGVGTRELPALLQRMGFDGIVHTGGKQFGGDSHTVYIAFQPDQVKSAISNTGEFQGPRFLNQEESIPVQKGFDELSEELGDPPAVTVPRPFTDSSAPHDSGWVDIYDGKIYVAFDDLLFSVNYVDFVNKTGGMNATDFAKLLDDDFGKAANLLNQYFVTENPATAAPKSLGLLGNSESFDLQTSFDSPYVFGTTPIKIDMIIENEPQIFFGSQVYDIQIPEFITVLSGYMPFKAFDDPQIMSHVDELGTWLDDGGFPGFQSWVKDLNILLDRQGLKTLSDNDITSALSDYISDKQVSDLTPKVSRAPMNVMAHYDKTVGWKSDFQSDIQIADSPRLLDNQYGIVDFNGSVFHVDQFETAMRREARREGIASPEDQARFDNALFDITHASTDQELARAFRVLLDPRTSMFFETTPVTRAIDRAAKVSEIFDYQPQTRRLEGDFRPEVPFRGMPDDRAAVSQSFENLGDTYRAVNHKGGVSGREINRVEGELALDSDVRRARLYLQGWENDQRGLHDTIKDITPDAIRRAAGFSEDGQPWNLSGQPRVEVRDVDPTSNNFKRWFRESQITDEQGNPQKVYHGTPVESPYAIFMNTVDMGWHFGTAAAANDRIGAGPTGDLVMEGARVGEFYIRLENPVIMRDHGTWNNNPKMLEDLMAGRYLTPAEVNDLRTKMVSSGYTLGDALAFRDIVVPFLQEKGYDGVRYRNNVEDGGSTSFIVWERDQIKSATSNTGAFSNHPSPLFQEEGVLPGRPLLDLDDTDRAALGERADQLLASMAAVEPLRRDALTAYEALIQEARRVGFPVENQDLIFDQTYLMLAAKHFESDELFQQAVLRWSVAANMFQSAQDNIRRTVPPVIPLDEARAIADRIPDPRVPGRTMAWMFDDFNPQSMVDVYGATVTAMAQKYLDSAEAVTLGSQLSVRGIDDLMPAILREANDQALRQSKNALFAYNDRTYMQYALDHLMPYSYWMLKHMAQMATYLVQHPAQLGALLRVMTAWYDSTEDLPSGYRWTVKVYKDADGNQYVFRPSALLPYAGGSLLSVAAGPTSNRELDWMDQLGQWTGFGGSFHFPLELARQAASTYTGVRGGIFPVGSGADRSGNLLSQTTILKQLSGGDIDLEKGLRKLIYGTDQTSLDNYYAMNKLVDYIRAGKITELDAKRTLLSFKDGKPDELWNRAMREGLTDRGPGTVGRFLGSSTSQIGAGRLAIDKASRGYDSDWPSNQKSDYIRANPGLSFQFSRNDAPDALRKSIATEEAYAVPKYTGSPTPTQISTWDKALAAYSDARYPDIQIQVMGPNGKPVLKSIRGSEDRGDAAGKAAVKAAGLEVQYIEAQRNRNPDQRAAVAALTGAPVPAASAVPPKYIGTPAIEQELAWDEALKLYSDTRYGPNGTQKTDDRGAKAVLQAAGLLTVYTQAQANRNPEYTKYFEAQRNGVPYVPPAGGAQSGVAKPAAAGPAIRGPVSPSSTGPRPTTTGRGSTPTTAAQRRAVPADETGITGLGRQPFTYDQFWEERRLLNERDQKPLAAVQLARNWDALVALGWQPSGEKPDLKVAEGRLALDELFDKRPESGTARTEWYLAGNGKRINDLYKAIGEPTKAVYPEIRTTNTRATTSSTFTPRSGGGGGGGGAPRASGGTSVRSTGNNQPVTPAASGQALRRRLSLATIQTLLAGGILSPAHLKELEDTRGSFPLGLGPSVPFAEWLNIARAHILAAA